VSVDGECGFILTTGRDKHTFQAKDANERDSWVYALELERADALEIQQSVIYSKGYREAMGKFKKDYESLEHDCKAPPPSISRWQYTNFTILRSQHPPLIRYIPD